MAHPDELWQFYARCPDCLKLLETPAVLLVEEKMQTDTALLNIEIARLGRQCFKIRANHLQNGECSYRRNRNPARLRGQPEQSRPVALAAPEAPPEVAAQ